MEERKIVWESMQIDNFQKSEKDDILEDLDDDDEDDQIIAEEIRNAPRLAESAFGLIELSDELNPFRALEFYMLHANFNIDAKCFIIANFSDGVEAVKSVSRYRLLVGFGKLFDKSVCKKELADKLINIEDYSNSLYLRQRNILMNHKG